MAVVLQYFITVHKPNFVLIFPQIIDTAAYVLISWISGLAYGFFFVLVFFSFSYGYFVPFYPRQLYLQILYDKRLAMGILSVCPSVCLSRSGTDSSPDRDSGF